MKECSDEIGSTQPELQTADAFPTQHQADLAYNMRKFGGCEPHRLQASLNEEDIQKKRWEAQGIHIEHDSHFEDGSQSVSCESSPEKGSDDGRE